MTTRSKLVFIIGAGPRIGLAVAERFLRDGYRVAIGKRNPQTLQDDPRLRGTYPVAVDVSQPPSVASAFNEVTEHLGIPEIVILNAASATFPTDLSNPFTVSPEAFHGDLIVNGTGGYAVLHHATAAFLRLKEHDGTASPIFIATGNLTPYNPKPLFVTLGSGKSVLAYLINIADSTYKDNGLKFYFVSKTTLQDGPTPVHGPEFAEVYSRIVNRGLGRDDWDIRFRVDEDGSILEVAK